MATKTRQQTVYQATSNETDETTLEDAADMLASSFPWVLSQSGAADLIAAARGASETQLVGRGKRTGHGS